MEFKCDINIMDKNDYGGLKDIDFGRRCFGLYLGYKPMCFSTLYELIRELKLILLDFYQKVDHSLCLRNIRMKRKKGSLYIISVRHCYLV